MSTLMDKKLNTVLRETREKKGISIESASLSTKIRKSILQEIEKGNYNSISSEIHLRNFILSYGKFLGISEEKILALYRRDLNVQRDNVVKPQNKIQNLIGNSKVSQIIKKIYQNIFTLKTLVLILAICIIGVTSYFFYRTWETSNTPPTLIIISPKNNEIIKQKNFIIEGISNSPDVKIYVDGIEGVYLNSEGRFKVEAKFNNPGLKRFNIIAINPLQKKSEYILDLIYEPENIFFNNQKLIKITNNSNQSKKIKIHYQKFEEIVLNPTQSYEIKINYLDKNEIKISNPEKAKLLITYFQQDQDYKQEHEILQFDNINILIKIIQENIFVIQSNE